MPKPARLQQLQTRRGARGPGQNRDKRRRAGGQDSSLVAIIQRTTGFSAPSARLVQRVGARSSRGKRRRSRGSRAEIREAREAEREEQPAGSGKVRLSSHTVHLSLGARIAFSASTRRRGAVPCRAERSVSEWGTVGPLPRLPGSPPCLRSLPAPAARRVDNTSK
jgi:hypothetical protein